MSGVEDIPAYNIHLVPASEISNVHEDTDGAGRRLVNPRAISWRHTRDGEGSWRSLILGRCSAPAGGNQQVLRVPLLCCHREIE